MSTTTDAAAEHRQRPDALQRLIYPASVAVAGISDTSYYRGFVEPLLSSGMTIYIINPRYDTVLGQKTYSSLSAVGAPIDAVVSFMSAERTTELVEEAAKLDIGGVVTVASGFGEFSDEGQDLQRRMRDAARASGLAVVGPNGLGYASVHRGISMLLESPHDRRPGGISLVSHSGGMLLGLTMATWQYARTGFNVLISAGNEAATDLADYVDFLAADANTTVIGLVIEKIRRPGAFFAAVRRAIEAGKPVVALKLARQERTQRMAASHTGALTGDAWVYDVALRQSGVVLAYDPEELIDRLALASQIPSTRWNRAEKLAVVSMTGGTASLSLDLAEVEGITMPPLDELLPWIKENLPGVTLANPLDVTGRGGPKWAETMELYGSCDGTDSLVFIHPMTDNDAEPTLPMLEAFTEAARSNPSKLFVAANVSGVPGAWSLPVVGEEVALGNGIRPTLRGLNTIGAFERFRASLREPVAAVRPLPRPRAAHLTQPEGAMLPFDATMKLLTAAGIPVAPYAIVDADVDPNQISVDFPGPYVVKLANVAHRTEHNAVRLNVGSGRALGDAVADLRRLAADKGLPAVVAVQPVVPITGEALLGIQGESELGPLVVFGLGGVFVEALGRPSGRMAPFDREEATGMIEEFRDRKVMHGFRGQPAWDHDALADILVAAGRLAAGGREWIASLDINPLTYGPGGYQAVDALLLLRA